MTPPLRPEPSTWTAATDPDFRTIAIQVVAELQRGVTLLESEVIGGAGRRNLRDSIDNMRTLLKVLQDATGRDGRWPGWKAPDPIERDDIIEVRVDPDAWTRGI